MISVYTAIRAARLIDRSQGLPTSVPRFDSFLGNFTGSPTPNRNATTGGQSTFTGPAKSHASSSGPSGFRMHRNARHLSPGQHAEYLAKGKCFNCAQPYSPLHKCPAKSLAVILDAGISDTEESEENLESDVGEGKEVITEFQQLQLSRFSSNGFDGAQTMKLFTRVEGRRLLTMVDSGDSHCFIAEHVARALQLTIEPASSFTVVLGDGTKFQAQGVCPEVLFKIDTHLFPITCYIFPLCGVDVILGVSWLAQLGDVTANWATLTMEFSVAGRKLCLRGDPSLTRRACLRTDLRFFETTDKAWLLWAVDG